MTVKKGAKLSVASKAFKKSSVKNVQVTVSKNASAKEIEKLKTMMQKAGISKKNIKIVKSKKVLK